MPELAKVENDEIVIRIPIQSLSGQAYQGLEQVGVEEDGGMDYEALAITLVSELNSEAEDGSTPVNYMLDAAVISAAEDGADVFAYLDE